MSSINFNINVKKFLINLLKRNNFISFGFFSKIKSN